MLLQNEFYNENVTIKDIKNYIKGLELLGKKIIKIKINALFDFDNKYYKKFNEEQINKIYRVTQADIEVIIKGNRLYYKDFLLPSIEIIKYTSIYFE